MKSIKTIDLVFHIISEPGDSTRYDYLLFKYYGEYICAGLESTFPFPDRIEEHIASAINTVEDSIDFLTNNNPKNVNPFTFLEVCQTIKELEKKYF